MASISIKRGKNFDEVIALKFADVPNGLTIELPAQSSNTGIPKRNLHSRPRTTPPW
jgi:hypothetical protein